MREGSLRRVNVWTGLVGLGWIWRGMVRSVGVMLGEHRTGLVR